MLNRNKKDDIMDKKESLYILTSEESNIPNYVIEFNANESEINNHSTYLIKFIFANRLCNLFGKYSQQDYRNLHDMELLYPLVKNGFVVVLGISDNMLVYLPKSLQQKQSQEFIELFSNSKNSNLKISISQLCDTEDFVPLEIQMTLDKGIDYIKKISFPVPSVPIRRTLKNLHT